MALMKEGFKEIMKLNCARKNAVSIDILDRQPFEENQLKIKA